MTRGPLDAAALRLPQRPPHSRHFRLRHPQGSRATPQQQPQLRRPLDRVRCTHKSTTASTVSLHAIKRERKERMERTQLPLLQLQGRHESQSCSLPAAPEEQQAAQPLRPQ